MIEQPLIFTQHIDIAATRKSYKDFGDKILITSIFRTIQSEGPLAGHPAIFVRTAGCNFGKKDHQCTWCDTSFQFDKGTLYTPEELLDAVKALTGYNIYDVLVITGGEPTLQHNLLPFIQMAHPFFDAVQIETNGTQPSFFHNFDAHTKVVVSPKASNKAHRYPELSDIVLQNATCLKFVVTSDWEDPQHEVPEWAFAACDKLDTPIYVSPMAVYKRAYAGEVSSAWDATLVDQEATARNYAYAAAYAMENNCLLSIQGHLFTAIA